MTQVQLVQAVSKKMRQEREEHLRLLLARALIHLGEKGARATVAQVDQADKKGKRFAKHCNKVIDMLVVALAKKNPAAE